LIGMLASANAMESSIAVPQKPKNRTTIWSSNNIPEHLSKRICSRIQQTHCTPNVYCSTIHNSQALQTAKISHNWWMY
jgi:hypothetical protein